jgi:hypothetical protein
MTSLAHFKGTIELQAARQGPNSKIGALAYLNVKSESGKRMDVVSSTDPMDTCPVNRTQRVCFDVGTQGENPSKGKLVVEVKNPIIKETCDLLQRSVADQMCNGWSVDPKSVGDKNVKAIMKKVKSMTPDDLLKRKTADDPQFPLEGAYCNDAAAKKDPESGEPIDGEMWDPTMNVKLECAVDGQSEAERKRCTIVYYAKHDPKTGKFLSKGLKKGYIWAEGVPEDYTLGNKEINAFDILKRGAQVTMELKPRPLYARTPCTYGCGWQAATITVVQESSGASYSEHQSHMEDMFANGDNDDDEPASKRTRVENSACASESNEESVPEYA